MPNHHFTDVGMMQWRPHKYVEVANCRFGYRHSTTGSHPVIFTSTASLVQHYPDIHLEPPPSSFTILLVKCAVENKTLVLVVFEGTQTLLIIDALERTISFFKFGSYGTQADDALRGAVKYLQGRTLAEAAHPKSGE